MSRVLLVTGEKKAAARLERIFSSVKLRCERAATFDAAFESIAKEPPALVVAELPDRAEPLQTLSGLLTKTAPATALIVTLRRPDVNAALEAMRAGAYDCVARPFVRNDVLIAARRAASRKGRALFVAKVEPKKKHPVAAVVASVLSAVAVVAALRVWNGPPPFDLNLGSAGVSGLQWQGRHLWAADWLDSSVTCFRVNRGLLSKLRNLEIETIYRVQNTQPILVCNTPDALVTVGSDLAMRSHQRTLGLPSFFTGAAPGAVPTGLAWDGKGLWSVDKLTGTLYRHSLDYRILETVKSPAKEPVGLAAGKEGLWVLCGPPLRVFEMRRHGKGWVWYGPYAVDNLLPEGVSPSGMAVGFDRLWVVSGGDPKMISTSIEKIRAALTGWVVAPKAGH
jgi:FixJ family two-component response regulator